MQNSVLSKRTIIAAISVISIGCLHSQAGKVDDYHEYDPLGARQHYSPFPGGRFPSLFLVQDAASIEAEELDENLEGRFIILPYYSAGFNVSEEEIF